MESMDLQYNKESEILALKGRDLDVAVAEQIFGWRWQTDEDSGDAMLVGPEFDWGGIKACPVYWPARDLSRYASDDRFFLPAFSEKIEVSWRIVERTKVDFEQPIPQWSKFWRFTMIRDNKWMAGIYEDNGSSVRVLSRVSDESLPTAICRVALIYMLRTKGDTHEG